jgi:hypothetical protein
MLFQGKNQINYILFSLLKVLEFGLKVIIYKLRKSIRHVLFIYFSAFLVSDNVSVLIELFKVKFLDDLTDLHFSKPRNSEFVLIGFKLRKKFLIISLISKIIDLKRAVFYRFFLRFSELLLLGIVEAFRVFSVIRS